MTVQRMLDIMDATAETVADATAEIAALDGNPELREDHRRQAMLLLKGIVVRAETTKQLLAEREEERV